jgi:dolichol-phosphate mannosyltransferase
VTLVSVILPTYNEAENMKLIIPAISEVMEENRFPYEIVVVDDDSPDGTARVASSLAAEYPVSVHLRKNERGLATAVMKGFELAAGQIVVLMDADMSHPVETIPSMIRPIMEGICDATVGSRYTEGGGCHDWPWIRRLISQGAALLARGVTKLTDPTSGFMAIRKNLLEGVRLDPVGWKIVLEVVVKVNPSLREIPIFFTDRIKGESKLSWKAQLDYLKHLWRLYNYRFLDWFSFIRFCLVGLSGMVIDTLILVGFVEILSLDPRAAAVFAFMGAVTWNFRINQSWTFSGMEYSKNIYWRYVTFVLICVSGLLIRIGTMHLLIRYTLLGQGRGYIFASIIGIMTATISNFLGCKYVSFSKKKSFSSN